jgi:DNA polymerase-3 subunit epsilon
MCRLCPRNRDRYTPLQLRSEQQRGPAPRRAGARVDGTFAPEKAMRTLTVVDVETTGLNPYRYDRVIEVAAVCLAPGQGILHELTSLVNPERDVGPTRIHGLTASDLVNAPRFEEIAGDLADFLRGSDALVGHNVRFDVSFLQSEYARIGVAMPHYATLDTLALAGRGTLSACCERHGVEFDGRAHAAIHDARATARLLQKILEQDPGLLYECGPCEAPRWPPCPTPRGRLAPRGSLDSLAASAPSYVQRLAEHLSAAPAEGYQSEEERGYRELLSRALEDGYIDESEGDSLVDVATHWGLSCPQVWRIHEDYLSQLVASAWADRCITDAEQREIRLVARLLGFGQITDNQLIALAQSSKVTSPPAPSDTRGEDWTGKAVCFTGECTCSIGGQLITREIAEQLAASNGLRVLPSVTKKLDLLVVADPNTQSGKARRARQYGIRIVHEPVFWRSLRISVD